MTPSEKVSKIFIPIPEFYTPLAVVTASSCLNVRDANHSGNVVDCLPTDTKVLVLGKPFLVDVRGVTGEWCYIATGPATYVACKYLRILE